MLPRDSSKKWKIGWFVFLLLFGIGALIAKDYLIPGSLISGNIAFMLDPKRSNAQKYAHFALLSVAIILACVHFYLRIKSARQ